MLTSFGTFWGAEGAGARWTGGDVAIVALIAFTLASSVVLVAVLRRRRTQVAPVHPTANAAQPPISP